MAQLQHALLALAAQHVHQVGDAEALAGAVDAGERLARRLRAVPGARRFQAVVAVAAGLRVVLAESREQRLPPAAGGLAEAQQHVELAALEPAAFFAGLGLFDHLPQQHHVAQAVAEPGLGRVAVAAGAAGFLVIAFQRLGQVQVRHEAHVGFVDAHAEGDGGHHHHAFLAQEAALVFRADAGVEAGVVGQGMHALLAQPGRGFFDLAARQAIDDARLAAPRRQEIEQLASRVVLQRHPVADVRPVEGGDEPGRVLQAQALGDFAPGGMVGGGGERDARHFRPALVQQVEFAVFGPEIVAPLRDAVRLVDGEQRDVAAPEQGQETLGEQALGRDVEQVQVAGQQPRLHRRRGFAGERGVEVGRAHAQLLQRFHLVLHQRDQRRHHDAGALAQQRRHLVTQRLAGTGGHQHQAVAAGDQLVHHGGLLATETGEAEDAAQQFEGGGAHDAILPAADAKAAAGFPAAAPEIHPLGVGRLTRAANAASRRTSRAPAGAGWPGPRWGRRRPRRRS